MKDCEFIMNELKTRVELNRLPLGYCDLLIGMGQLEKHRVMLDCYDKTFACLYDKANTIIVK